MDDEQFVEDVIGFIRLPLIEDCCGPNIVLVDESDIVVLDV